MHEWKDSTLVAICSPGNNKHIVWELPARERTTVSTRGRSFHSEERAERFIEEQFGHIHILRVTPDDILEEVKRRSSY